MNEELRALLKEAYDRGANREQLDAIVERYNASKKKEEPIPSESSDGVSASPEIDYGPDSFKQVTGVDSKDQKEEGPTVGQWFGNIYNGLVEGVQDFLYPAAESTGITDKNILSFIEQKQEEYPELYDSYLKSLEGGAFQKLGYEEEKAKELAARTAYSKYWESNNDIENEVMPFIRGERRETAVKEVGVDIPEDIKQELDEQFWNSSLKGLMSSLPAMVASSTTMGGSFVVQSYYSREEEIASLLSENPDLEMSKSQQEAYKITGALVEGALEKVGLSGALKGSPALTKLVTSKVLDKALKSTRKATKETIDRYVNESVQEVLGRVAGGSLAEFETGALQQLSDDALKGLVNTAKGKEFFDPKSLANVFKDALYAGAQEAVGGGVISSAAMLGTSSREQRVREINEEIESLKNKRDASQTEGEKAVVDEVITDLKTELNKEVRDSFKEYEAFSEKDINKITDLNSQIADAAAKYKVAESESLKEKYKEEIIGLRAEKEAIESKYDSKEEERVPSPEQEAEAPVEAEPVAEPSKEEAPTDRDVQEAEEEVAVETPKSEELDIILLDEVGGQKELTSTGGSDPRNIETGKMTVEYGEEGLTFKTESDTGRMKEEGGEMFVPYSLIEKMPNINKFEKGTKDYAYHVAALEGIADAYKGDPVDLLMDRLVKPENIGKKGTNTENRFTEEDGKRIASMISNYEKITKSLGKRSPNVVFAKSFDIKPYFRYLTGNEKKSVSKGTYLPVYNTIIINLDKADIGTVAHELTHAYVRAVKLDRKKVVDFTNVIESELAKGTENEIKLGKELGKFRDEYVNRKIYGERTKDDPNIAEEFLAEYVGMMSKFSEDLPPAKQVSFIEKVRAAVVKFLAKLGIVDKNIAVKIKTREEALDFINNFLDALQGRTEVTADTEVQIEEQGESGEVGTISIPKEQIEVIDAPKASEDPRDFVRDFVSDIDIKELSGRKFVTNMYDYTNAGLTQLGKGLSINLLGGRNYVPLMLKLNGKKLGEVSNLAAFNTKSQAEGFIRNAQEGKADLFAPHAGTLTDSWQFQHHIFEELVNLVLDNKIMSKAKLMETFNEAIKSKEGAKAFSAFNDKNKSRLKNLNSFKKDPMKLVELLNAENNYSPNLRKALNQKIAASKDFQQAIGIKNLNQFYNLIADPLNEGVSGGEVMTFVEFDPKTFEVVKTNPGDVNHHPSFGWVVMAKIKRILQPNKYYKSYDLTKEYTKYNVSGPEVSTKEDPKFAVSNVTSSAGAIPKVAKVDVREQIDFAGVDMNVQEVPAGTSASIPTGGMAYVPVSKLYDLMDMRDGDRGGLYDTARDKKRVNEIAERFKKEGYNSTDGWYQPIYIDIDAGGFGWIGEGNHRVLAAMKLGMTHLPVRVEFGAARDGKFVYHKNWSRVPTQVVTEEKIEQLKEQAGPYYHIKYASIWETDLPTNEQPTPVSREQIDFEGSEMINEFSWTEQVVDPKTGKLKTINRTEKSDKPIGIKFPDGTVALVRSFDTELKEAQQLLKKVKSGAYPYMDEDQVEYKIDLIEKRIKRNDVVVELIDGDMKYHKGAKYGRSAMPMGSIELSNNHYNYYFPRVAKMLGKDHKAGLMYSPDNTRGTSAVEIYEEFQGKGFGSRLYFAALRLLRQQVPGARLISNHDFNVRRKAKNFWRSQVNNGLARVIANTASKQEIEQLGGPEVLKQLKDIGAEYTGDIYELLDPTERTTPSKEYDVAKETEVKEQIDWQPSLFGKGQVNPAIVNRATPVQNAALDLLQGKITNAEYQETVRITQPIEAITRFFLPASTKDMQDSLDSNKGKLLNAPLEDGKEIGLRLDIPAYKNRNIWVVSVHDKGKSGKSISYGSVAWATDVKFGSNPKVAAFIAAGQNLDTLKKQDKTTIARMLGKWKNFDGKTKEERDASAVKKVEEIVAIENSYPGAGRKGSPWRQIGMNPFRHSYFYDRRNGKPVIAAAEVVQIGGLVYAKDVVYADKNDPVFEVTDYKDAAGEPVKFQIEDQANEDTANENTYSSVEKNAEAAFQSDVDAQVDADVSDTKSWTERPRTVFERFVDLTRLKIQDKFRRLIEIQENIEYSRGEAVGLDEDFRNAETTMHGRAKNKLDKSEEMVADIANKIKKSGLSLDEFNDLLYAMHAQERNRYLRIVSTDVGKSLSELRKQLKMKPSEVAEILGVTTQEYIDIEANKTPLSKRQLFDIVLIYGTTPSRFFYDYSLVKEGSGMKDTEAREILAKYGLDLVSPDVSQLSPKVRAAVQAVRDLTKDTRDKLVESGLESESTIQVFEETYKNYVPLRGFAEGDVESEIIEGGRKLEVRGREKRAKGRETKADSPLTQAIIANTTTIIRAEKNAVMTKFFNLAKNNPNEDVYEIVDPDITTEYKREVRQGKIITTAKTVADYISDPKMVSIREDGDYKFIRFKDQKLADAFRGANVVKAEFMTKYLGQFNRMLSSFITTYDPEFVLRNFSRDIQTAVLNLYSEQEISEGLIKDKNIVANTVKDTLPSFWSIMKVESGKSSKNKEMDRYYKEFKEDGAKTEWFYSKSAAELQKDIEKLIEGKGESSLQAAANVVERLNSSVENAVRLSSYVNARKAGLPREKAAELAKNLTVNFNKSGEWGQVGNSLFLFFNASTQGTSRLIRSLKPRYVVDSEGNRKLQVTTAQKMAIGLSLLGSLLSVLNEGMSDDDEDGKSFYSKISDFEKERNIIIMKPNGRDYFKIPLPYGVNVFYVAGTLLADAAQKIKTPGEVAGGILEAALGSFSPINFPNSDDTFKFFQKFITPTIGQVPLAIAINENYFGRTIYNENFPGDPTPLPESQLGRKGGYRWTKQLTKFLNKVTGGSEFRSGAIDINPDKIDFIMESYSGGMGKFTTRTANTLDKIITGNWDDLEPRQVPFLRVFYGQTPKYANVQEFYSRYYLVNQMREEVKNGIITGPEAIKINKIYNQAKSTKKILSDIKKKEDKAMGIKDAAVQEKRMDALESARYKNVAVFNKMYETLNIDKIK